MISLFKAELFFGLRAIRDELTFNPQNNFLKK